MITKKFHNEKQKNKQGVGIYWWKLRLLTLLVSTKMIEICFDIELDSSISVGYVFM